MEPLAADALVWLVQHGYAENKIAVISLALCEAYRRHHMTIEGEHADPND